MAREESAGQDHRFARVDRDVVVGVLDGQDLVTVVGVGDLCAIEERDLPGGVSG